MAAPMHSQLVNGGITVEYPIILSGEPHNGVNHLNQILDQDPLNAVALLKRSQLHALNNDVALANVDRELALQINPYSPLYTSREDRKAFFAKRNYEFVTNKANTKINSFEKSYLLEDEYVRVLDASNITKSSKMLLESALEAIQEGEYITAEQRLARVSVDDRNNALWYDLHGIILIEREEFDNAIDMFTNALEVDNKFTIAYHNRAIAHKFNKNYTAAEEDFAQALRQRADLVKIKFSKAKLLERKGESERAEMYYEDAMKSGVDYKEARLNYSTMLKSAGEYTKAMIEVNDMISNTPDDANNYYVRGGLHFIYGEYDNAISDFEEYLKTNPNDNEVMYYKGISMVLDGDIISGCQEMNYSLSGDLEIDGGAYLYMCQ